MPPIAWSNSGELVAYGDIHTIRHGAPLSPGDVLPPATVKSLRRGYYAAVSHMDVQLGRVLDALDAAGYANDTIISFMGDHGWQLGDIGEWCKVCVEDGKRRKRRRREGGTRTHTHCMLLIIAHKL
jgi:iduronate 2-sulfatase